MASATPHRTPNPRALKFVLDVNLPERIDAHHGERSGDPFVRAVLDVPGVESVFGVNDFVTVTRAPEADWDPIVCAVQDAAGAHLHGSGAPPAVDEVAEARRLLREAATRKPPAPVTLGRPPRHDTEAAGVPRAVSRAAPRHAAPGPRAGDGSHGPTPLGVLGAGDAAAIAELCRRGMPDPPAVDEVERCLFAPDRPALVRGEPDTGVVATERSGDSGFVKLLVVDPGARRRGHGRRLLEAAEADLAGCASITLGADAPYFLFPGIETSLMPMICLAEQRHYGRADTNVNLGIELSRLPADPGGHEAAGPGVRDELDDFTTTHWPGWRLEALRALDRGTLVVGRDEAGLTGFCAWDVNRRGRVGPVAVRPDLLGRGAGRPILLGALHRLRSEGGDDAEIVWVGPIAPYARLGATVRRLFFVYRRTAT